MRSPNTFHININICSFLTTVLRPRPFHDLQGLKISRLEDFTSRPTNTLESFQVLLLHLISLHLIQDVRLSHYVPQVIGEAHLLRPRVKDKLLCLFPTWSIRGIDFGLDLGDFVFDLGLVDFCCDVDLALRPLFFDMEED